MGPVVIAIAVLVTLIIAVPVTAVVAISYRKKVVEDKRSAMPTRRQDRL